MKRGFDIGASTLGLAVLSPLLLGIAVSVRCTSPGPALYRQQRLGRNGKPFMMLKFRSMLTGSESVSAWTVRNDPRRTDLGIWLRRFSLDELPQLINVFRGDMSLVGPRPEQPCIAAEFQECIPDYAKRYQVRPGITGLAQVNGFRGDTSIEARTSYDLRYIEKWTLGLDAKILFRTLFGGMINKQEYPELEKEAGKGRYHQ